MDINETKTKWSEITNPFKKEQRAENLCNKLDDLNLPEDKVDRLYGALINGPLNKMSKVDKRRFESIMKKIETAANAKDLSKADKDKLIANIDKATGLIKNTEDKENFIGKILVEKPKQNPFDIIKMGPIVNIYTD